MKQKWVVLLSAAAAIGAMASPGDRLPNWRQVRDAISKGLPRTALEHIDPIIQGAHDERAHGEAVRATLLKIALQAGIEGNRPEEKIRRLETELALAPHETRPIMRAVMARWYWQYFEQNRWRFLRRSTTAESPGSDFTTWDLPRLYAEIDRNFQLALADAPALQRRPIAEFAALYTGGNAPDAYRPTLFDAVAFDAIQFYSSGEQAAARPEDAFVLQAESPALSSSADFVRWSIPTADTASPVVRALRVYQELIRCHTRDRRLEARLDADLWRLQFAHDRAVGPARKARYEAALRRFVELHSGHELSARALHTLADLRVKDDPAAALRLAKLGFDRFPTSVGGRRCYNLIQSLEMPDLRVGVSETIWNSPPPTIEIHYRNLTRVRFRLVPFDYESLMSVRQRPPGPLKPAELADMRSRPPAREWSVDLPATPDLRHRIGRVAAPVDVPAGSYVLLAATDPDFGSDQNVVDGIVVWVARLSVVLRTGRPQGLEGFVLDAATGAPQAGAAVRTWQWIMGERRSLPGPDARTDANGMFRIERPVNLAALHVRHRDQRVAVEQWFPSHVPYPHDTLEQTLLFTDRAVYRPGQTIHYKGLCLDINPNVDRYRTLAGRKVVVALDDANGREVARAEHVTNAFGSFSGTFTADHAGLLGRRYIEVEEGPHGVAHLRVEEYKRPRFFVTLDAPARESRLASPVEVAGHALGYQGAPVDGARVTWRVVRSVRYPPWWEWRFGWFSQRAGGAQEIAHGTATTNAEGRFVLSFRATPDSSVAPEQEPVFHYQVHADVTDGAGETRSARREVRVGYAAIQAALSLERWQEARRPVEITLRSATLDDAPRPAKGRLTVLRLREPMNPRDAVGVKVRHGPPAESGRSRMAGFHRGEGPGRPDLDRLDPNRWPEAEAVFDTTAATDTLGTTRIVVTLGPGLYRARFETRDRFGNRVTATAPIQVVDPDLDRSPVRVADTFVSRAATIEVGGEYLAVWGTAHTGSHAYVEVECRGRMLQAYWIRPGQTQKAIRQRVEESMRGGFTVRVTRVCENRAYLHEQTVEVPWSDRRLDVRWEHFTSTLQPGQDETWTAVVRGPDSTAAVAEMVATLYDASLDAFAPIQWPGRISGFRQNRDRRGAFVRNDPVWLWRLAGYWFHPELDSRLEYRAIPGGLLVGDYTYGLSELPGAEERTTGGVVPAVPAPGKGRGQIHGRLVDVHGNPVPYANVVVVGARIGTLSDENGFYLIRGVPPGWAKLRVDALGFAREERSVDVLDGKRTPADFRLMVESSVRTFEGIEIRAGKGIDTKSTTTKQSISAEQLSGRPLDNLREAVGTRAGVAAMGGELHFRGGRGGEVRFAFDLPPDLAEVVARRDLRETAFFFPHLLSDSTGAIRMEFRIPEGLTAWRFVGFAHDPSLRSGVLEGRAVTSQDLMVQPNPPRFLREGDELEFTVKVTNRTDAPQRGRARLTFHGALDDQPADSLLGNWEFEREFSLAARASATCSWRLHVGDGEGVYGYRAVAATARFSDGEEGALPVLPRRMLVTESLLLPIRGARSRSFDFERLRLSASSATLRHRGLTVQMVSNPAWYAVMALPYLMEYPYECSEQTFNRLYANSLARHLAVSDPRIRRTFDAWRDTPALDSPLERNQDLKSVLIAETPWLRQARSESQARRNVGLLFDSGRLEAEQRAILTRLERMQLHDGAWPWFPGGPANDYITLYITTGFGRLRHLGVDVSVNPALRALGRLDGWVDQRYRRILARGDTAANHLTPDIALYLYGRSFFAADRPVGAIHREALAFWIAQGRRYWLRLDNRQSKAHLALAMRRFGDLDTARGIMGSIREYAVTDEELGMFWRDTERSWWWYRAPIETQAMMIEALDEVLADSAAVEDCRVWLLKQKQTQDWKTTKATADAVYALLLRGTDLLASQAPVTVALADSVVRPGSVEAGTGFYERRFAAHEILPEMGRVTVTKPGSGVAWGSLHWQYLEDVDRVTAYAGTPLRLTKRLYVRSHGKAGPEMHLVDAAVGVGAELVVRLELYTDRDMEYVHLKDSRASGVEPVGVLSGYRFQDGLRYYEETRDAASHFFIDYLPKGTYVFEYSVRVQHRGRFTSGVAEIQCMYAPEFNSHSGSVSLTVD